MANAREDVRALLQQAYRYARALTHDPTRAEDLVQDAWLRVLTSGGALTPPNIFRALYCRFVDLHRRDRRVRFEALPNDPPASEPADAAEDWRGDVSPEALDHAMAQLLPEERALTYLAYVAQWPIAQIAELMEWPRGTVLSVLHRVRRRLQGELSARRVAS